jgi:hypothetical protein
MKIKMTNNNQKTVVDPYRGELIHYDNGQQSECIKLPQPCDWNQAAKILRSYHKAAVQNKLNLNF